MASASLASNEELRRFFEKVISRVQGLQSISVSDREGVPLVRYTATGSSTVSTEEVDTAASTFAVCAEQASKLQMGKNKTITTFLRDRIVVHINHLPMVITLTAEKGANVGVMLAVAPELKKALDPLMKSLLTLEAESERS